MFNARKLCSITDAMLESQAGSSSQAGAQPRNDDAAALRAAICQALAGEDGPKKAVRWKEPGL